jgi:arylsulfatase A-like enzyme
MRAKTAKREKMKVSPKLMAIKYISGIVFLCLLFSPGQSLGQSPPALKDYNVLLITVDCLRPDHIGLYGYRRNTTPNIDRFFQGAAVFQEAIAQAPWTSPSILSMLTGLYPAVHAMDVRGKLLDKYFYTPLKQLKENGYYTLGYMTFDNYSNQGWDEETKKGNLIEILEKHKGEKFFAWQHFRGPHLPYSPPDAFKDVFLKGPYSISPQKAELIRTSEKIPKGSVEFDEKDADFIRDSYDSEVLYQDDQLEKLFLFLKDSGLLEKTIVVLTADHGEELLEHGFIGHASTSEAATAFDEVLRVPLLIRIPGMAFDRPIPGIVQHVHLMPTLFDLLGIKPKYPAQGKSLLPLMLGKNMNAEDFSLAFVETSYCGWQCPKERIRERIHALRSREWKFIEERKATETVYSLYHLSVDPGEKNNLYGKEKEIVKKYQAILSSHQRTNLNMAAALAKQAAEKHFKESEGLMSRKNYEDAVKELEQVLHLDEIYTQENPSFTSDPELGKDWKNVMSRIYELLGRAYSERAREANK